MRRSVSRISGWSSRSAVSRSLRWRSSSSTCSSASLYSSCASGLTGPSCSRRRCRRSMRVLQRRRARSSGSGSSDGSGSRPSLVARRVSSSSASCAWSRARCAWTSPRVTSSPRCLSRWWTRDSSAAHSRSSAVSLLAGRAVGGELGLEHLDAGADRLARALQRRGEPVGDGLQRLVAGEPAALVLEPARALVALALGALGEPLLGLDRGLDLRAALGARPLVGRGAPLLDDPARVTLGLGGLVAGPRGRPRLAVDRVARARPPRRPSACAASTSACAARSACAATSTCSTSASRRLRSASTRSAPPGATCRSSRVDGDQTRPSLVTATPVKAGSSPSTASTTHTSCEERGREARAASSPVGVTWAASGSAPGAGGPRRTGGCAERRAAGRRPGDAAAAVAAAAARRQRRGGRSPGRSAPPRRPCRALDSSAAPASRSAATAARMRGPRAAVRASS